MSTSQPQPTAPPPPSFAVTCPSCGRRLRFSAGAEAPPRLRIRCSSCQTTFGVRRPGADPDAPSLAGVPPPTLAGIPVAGSSVPHPGTSGSAESVLRTGPLPDRATVSAPPRREEEAAFSPGELIADRYRIVRFVARGGMGEVYEVDDLELRERVALKTVRPEVARDGVVIERFRREIQLARKVTHPNVCRIFDVSHHRDPGRPGAATIFLTMELLSGETLAQRIRRAGPMPPEEALPIVRQIAQGLHAAHQAGVIHRDLKPGNVMLAASRGSIRAVVTDFGLARPGAGGDPGLTLTGGGVVGTPAYLAPEQIEGGEITPAVDVYALGIVLYEMLTGTVPFVGDTALATAVKRLREAPAAPRTHVPGLDPRWDAAILRCLEREPAARFATALEVVDALTAPIAEPRPAERVATPPVAAPAPARAAAGSRRRQVQLAALAALILLSAAITYYRYTEWRAAQRAPQQGLRLPAGAMTPRPSVAVLGFKNLSGKQDVAWLSSALAELLSSELAGGGDLRVIASENVARSKVETGLGEVETLARDDLRRLRSLLGTDAVVAGSYLALGGAASRQIRLDLRLQDTVAGDTTATVSETGAETELFQLVARTARRLRQAMGVGGPGEPAAARAVLPSNPEAARLYAEGISKLRLFDPVGARDLLVRAAAIEPDNALVHSGLAAAWAALGYDGKAREAAKAALDRSAGLPREEQLVIHGRYREAVQDWGKAAEIYWQLWSMFPDNLDYGLRLAGAQAAAGRVADALATTEALRSLPPPARDDPRIDLAEATAAGARSDFDRQQKAAARAAAKGKAQQAPLMVAQARLLECRALRNLGQAGKALAACDEGRRLHARVGDRSGVAESLLHAANVRYDRGDLPGALQLSEAALRTYREIGSRSAEAGALNNIAVVLKRQGDLDRARRLYEEVLAITRETGSRTGEAYALNNLAGVLLQRGELEESGKLFAESLRLRRELGDRSGEAYALDNLGVVLRKRGDLPGARRRHEEALRIRRGIGQKIGEVASLNNLGTVLFDQGELAAARTRFEASLALCRAIGNRSAQAYALFGLGEVLAAEGRLAEARKHHEEALELRTGLGEKSTAAESRLALASLLLDAGEAGRAGELARTAAAELARQGATDGEALALSLAALAAGARGDGAGAGQAIDRAASLLAGRQDLRTRLTVQLRAARLGRPAAAGEALRLLAEEAARAGLLGLQLEAELARAEADLADGRASDGQSRLATLEKQAQELGYGRVARKAAAARGKLDRTLRRS